MCVLFVARDANIYSVRSVIKMRWLPNSVSTGPWTMPTCAPKHTSSNSLTICPKKNPPCAALGQVDLARALFPNALISLSGSTPSFALPNHPSASLYICTFICSHSALALGPVRRMWEASVTRPSFAAEFPPNSCQSSNRPMQRAPTADGRVATGAKAAAVATRRETNRARRYMVIGKGGNAPPWSTGL